MKNRMGAMVASMMALALAGDGGIGGELPEDGDEAEALPSCRCPMKCRVEAHAADRMARAEDKRRRRAARGW